MAWLFRSSAFLVSCFCCWCSGAPVHPQQVKEGDWAFSTPAHKTPSRIHLQRTEQMEWSKEAEVKATLAPLQNLFTPLGYFTLQEMPVKLAALTLSGQQVYAVVYEHPVAGVWAEIYSRYRDWPAAEDLHVFEHSASGADQMDTPPLRRAWKIPGLDIEALFQRFIHERPAYELEAVQPDQFPVLLKERTRTKMDWRNSRGGPTEEEIRRVAAATERRGRRCDGGRKRGGVGSAGRAASERSCGAG